MRVVLDSNVLLAAFGSGGICRAIVDVCRDSHQIILSETILEEVRQHLTDSFRHTLSMANERVSSLREAAVMVVPVKVDVAACRDPNDIMVLGTVLAGGADCLVTGDKDLLVLGEFVGRPILSPREFWARLK